MTNQIDFKKYKSCLKDVLNRLGYNTSTNPMCCISPHHNDKTPSMLIYDEYFKCQSCEANGDVYDAIGLLKGINERFEQFKEIQAIMGDNYVAPINNKKEFQPNKIHEKSFREYLFSQQQKNIDKIKSYLKKRKQPEEMINSLCNVFGWWPGYEIAESDIGKEVLFGAGIPGKNPKTGMYSWGPAGVVIKLGIGFKLFYYDENGKSQKIGTKKCRTFPTPKLPDNDTIFLVEGENSAISMIYAGWQNTSAIGGVKALTDEAIKELFQYDNVYIIFDGDGAGRKNREKLKEKLLQNGYTGNIYIVRIPGNEKQDPDDLIKDGKKEIIQKAIEESKIKQDEVNHIIEESKEDSVSILAPFLFMGYDEKNYYVIPTNQSIPIKIGRPDNQIKGMMYDLASYDWWCNKFPKETKDGDLTLNIFDAVKWFREKAQKKGIYDESILLGSGAHLDNEDIIVNLGDSLYSKKEKKKISFSEYTGKKFYKRSNNIFNLSGDAWNIKESHDLFKEILNYGFGRNLDFILLTGFIALAPFASLLHRRPHLAIMGPRGCGKTTLVMNIIRPAIGNLGIYVEGKTSEAGIRQRIGTDCRPTIIDEFEAHNADEQQRNKNILSLARSAYGGEGEIIKGTTGQKPIIFKTKTMFMFLAININFDNDADRTRIPILKMQRSSEKIGKSFDFSGLRKRIFDNINSVLKNIESAKNYITEKHDFDARTGDTFGTLIGGFWSTISNLPFLEEKNEEINQMVIDCIKDIKNEEEELNSDEDILLNSILNHKIKIDGYTEKTIAEMITIPKNEISPENLMYDHNLRQIGIRKDPSIMLDGEKRDVLAISANNNYISDILKNTPYQKYKNILLRHEAAIFQETRPIRMIANKRERCIILDWNKLKDFYFEDDNKSLPF